MTTEFNANPRAANDEMITDDPRNPIALYLGFALVIAFIIVIAGTSLAHLRILQEEFERVVNTHEDRISLARTISFAARERIPLLYAMTMSDDPFERDEMRQDIYALGEQFLNAREALVSQDLDSTEAALLENQREYAKEAIAIQRRMLDLIDQGKLEKARNLIPTHAKIAQERALRPIDALIDYERLQAQKALTYAQETAWNASHIIVGLAIVAVIASVFIGILVVMRLTRSFEALRSTQTNLENRVRERTKQLEMVNDQLQDMAHRDPLTGLPNRALLVETLSLFLARAKRRNSRTAVLFLDLDDFKPVNDQFGHRVGDALLTDMSKRLTQALREEDTVARFGGDEFVVVINDLETPGSAIAIAEKVLEQISRPFHIQGVECRIAASIGVAIYPDHGESVDSLIQHADEAMYAGKRAGKQTVRLFDKAKPRQQHREQPIP